MSKWDPPKLPGENARWRKGRWGACDKDEKLVAYVRGRCKRDILFWVNGFCSTYDPRTRDKVLPFVTWPFQDKCLLALQSAMRDGEDIVIEKSRDMGASWLCALTFLHPWQFESNQAFAMVSRTEDLVDNTGDPDSLFWKLDFLLKNQPAFLVPRYRRRILHFDNDDNGSVIDGYSTTGNVLRGGHKTAVLLDEFAAFELADGFQANASTEATTRCRIMNSTYQGTVGAFYQQSQRKDIRKVRMHWSEHPEKAKGLSFDLQGKASSPWYVKACERLGNVKSVIAQELDINPIGSGDPFFEPELINRLLEEETRSPYITGRLVYDELEVGDYEFVESSGGEFLLWTNLLEGRPEHGDFSIGCDVSAGTGATNSVMSIADRRTGEKVGEFASPHLGPEKFAELVVATAKWFHEAYLLWEMNGPGGTFGARVIALGYRNIYWRTNEKALSRKSTDTPGYFATNDNKELLFRTYGVMLNNGKFINRSAEALRECLHYVYSKTGKIENTRAKDPEVERSGAGENHGDRVIADALCCKGVDEFVVVKVEPEKVILPGSLAWHRKKEEGRRSLAASW